VIVAVVLTCCVGIAIAGRMPAVSLPVERSSSGPFAPAAPVAAAVAAVVDVAQAAKPPRIPAPRWLVPRHAPFPATRIYGLGAWQVDPYED
jgi:hypothetical protein